KNIAESMIPGTLSSVIMPFIVKGIGVGEEAQGRWLSFMAILSAVAVPGALIEYYFTKERVSDQKKHVRFWEQLKESLKYKEWLIILAIIALKALDGSLTNNVMIYYCNWVAGSSVSEGAKYQALLNVIGQFPLGIGVILLWPIMRKYGKYNVMRIGFLIGIVGCLIMVFSPGNFYVMLVGMFLKSIGSIPTTMSISFLSDVIDRIERKTGYRFDSLGASINSMIQNITLGAAQTALLLGVNRLGYIVTSNSEQVIQHPQIVRSFFSLCMTGVPLICFILCFALINILSKKVEEKKD
ncbi:MAG: MFS transporter, partial [Oscillospiraceae bacterium]|nr:MFS transporter [Oscillospiraceae bacterium]